MYWTNFWQPTVPLQQSIFEKTLLKDCRSHVYASFDTFCVQIGQLFDTQWVFDFFLKTVKSLFSKSLKSHCDLNNFLPIWTQKLPIEAYRVELSTFIRAFQKYFVVYERERERNQFFWAYYLKLCEMVTVYNLKCGLEKSPARETCINTFDYCPFWA